MRIICGTILTVTLSMSASANPLSEGPARTTPDWFRNGVMYQIQPRAFTPEGTIESAWGFHPYFRVTDAERVAVDGEKMQPPSVRIQSSAAEKGRCRTLTDLVSGRKIAVECTDNEDWFVWNPGVERTPLCETLGPDEWKGFYCVEPCTLAPRSLAPGESRKHEMSIRVE